MKHYKERCTGVGGRDVLDCLQHSTYKIRETSQSRFKHRHKCSHAKQNVLNLYCPLEGTIDLEISRALTMDDMLSQEENGCL